MHYSACGDRFFTRDFFTGWGITPELKHTSSSPMVGWSLQRGGKIQTKLHGKRMVCREPSSNSKHNGVSLPSQFPAQLQQSRCKLSISPPTRGALRRSTQTSTGQLQWPRPLRCGPYLCPEWARRACFDLRTTSQAQRGWLRRLQRWGSQPVKGEAMSRRSRSKGV